MITNYINSSGIDLGNILVPKSYLIDRYPDLAAQFKFAGLWLWGYNNTFYGQLGDNTTTSKSSPVQISGGGYNWKLIAAGNYTTAAIKTDGTLWTWGSYVGDGTTVSKSSPILIYGGSTDWKDVKIYNSHAIAIKTDGTLWTWGSNGYGQLGIDNRTDRTTPVQTIVGGTDWRSVSVGKNFSASIKIDGTLWTWGRNNNGQLGDNTIVNKSSPIPVSGGGTNWKLISCGQYHTAAIKTDGTLWLWGDNNSGQLGDNTLVDKYTPVQISGGGTNWKLVSGGKYHTAAIKTDGTLWLWGDNNSGKLGDNTTTGKSTPIQTISVGTNWNTVVTGLDITAAIKTDGTLWLWGKNNYGQLGNNTTSYKSTPIQTISAGVNWKLIACTGDHIAAIRDEYDNLI